MLMGYNSVLVKGQVRSGLWAYDIDQWTITAFLPCPRSRVAFSADGRTGANWDLFKKTDILLWDLTQLP
jgi:hypothetical protein